jgi:flagellar hook-associated protein 3 FlgL
MRITEQMLTQTTLNNIEANISRLNTVEAQVSSGVRITKPSDDPIGTAQALGFQESIDQTNQYLTNINQATSWLSATDSALSDVDSALQRSRQLAVEASNGTLTGADRQSIAAEVQQLQQQVLSSSQDKYGSSYLFSGTKSDAPGYVSANPSSTPGAYQGNSGLVQRQVGPGQTVAVNTDAKTTFDPVFTALNNLQSALNSNNDAAVQSSISDIDTALTAVLKARSAAGAMTSRLTTLQTQMTSVQTNMQGLLSKVKDVDMAKAITDYQMAQNVYNASLQAGAKAMQPSLLDYLK